MPEGPAEVEVVIPVYNEERALPPSVATLRAYLSQYLPYTWRITIANNASTDGTLGVAQELARAYPELDYVHLDLKGRGRALRAAWGRSDARVLCYTDVDLSAEVAHLADLVALVAEGRADIAIGTRLHRQSRTNRSVRREIISRGYNLIVKLMFGTRFSDAQCGFKAISREAAGVLLPLVKDQGWFFDSELLIIAEKRGYRIGEVPVVWREDPDSRVKIVSTAWEDLKGLFRVRRTHPW
ncbi:MAG: glycosyltransferase family 2 protein [Chloroflexi bacterium]|nr:glycosyltransferase family 2 protein [Chloroflexota bacterium]